MRTTKITILAIILLIIGACSASKKSTMATASSASPSDPVVFTKPANGVFAPGDEEVKAIQTKYSDVTLDKLKEGHMLYTQSACVKCHNAKNIYTRGEEQWKDIIENMAIKAKISDTEKDAVYKYVLAIKATQPK